MIRFLLLISVLFAAPMTFAAPRCLDLTKRQADKAVSVMKIGLYQGASLRYVSKKEGGLVKPLGVWAEQTKKHRKKNWRVRVDGREIDLALVYMLKDAKEARGWNLAWLAGCNPGSDKAQSLRFER